MLRLLGRKAGPAHWAATPFILHVAASALDAGLLPSPALVLAPASLEDVFQGTSGNSAIWDSACIIQSHAQACLLKCAPQPSMFTVGPAFPLALEGVLFILVAGLGFPTELLSQVHLEHFRLLS